MVRLNKSVCGLKHAARTWCQLLSFMSTPEEIGFEQCLVDTCVLRLVGTGATVTPTVMIHADKIQIAAYQGVANTM